MAQLPAIAPDDLETAFGPVIRWIVDERLRARSPPASTASQDASTSHHVANRLYREQR